MKDNTIRMKSVAVKIIVLFGVLCLMSNIFLVDVRRTLVEDSTYDICRWSSVDGNDSEAPDDIQATVIAGFPGVGKHLIGSLVEQLTNRQVGFDYLVIDPTLQSYENKKDVENVVAIVTTYPHPEGNWIWGDRMNQSILVIRNPIDTFRSQHSRTNVGSWHTWRDAFFHSQMDLYVKFIEFWMENGKTGNETEDGEFRYDLRCKENITKTCIPKAVFQYEAFLDSKRGEDETIKLAKILNNCKSLSVVDPSIWSCVYNRLMKRNELYSTINQNSNALYDDKIYSHIQLAEMKLHLEHLRDKYAQKMYIDTKAANDLVAALNSYLVDISYAFDQAWNLFKEGRQLG